MKPSRWMDVGVGVLVVCALVVTGLVVRRELISGGDPGAGSVELRSVDDWRDYASSGHRMGPGDAPVVITEFSDFQCPYCRQAARRLEKLRAAYPQDVAVVYRHFPLPAHPHAVEAARAAECAADQDRFPALHDALFGLQDSIGAVAWSRFAREADLPDVDAFRDCLADETAVAALERDTAAAHRLGVTGTPTILVNDVLLQGAPSYRRLEEHVERILAD